MQRFQKLRTYQLKTHQIGSEIEPNSDKFENIVTENESKELQEKLISTNENLSILVNGTKSSIAESSNSQAKFFP